MFLRAKTRFKDGKEHRYWSIVESRRTASGRVVQRHVLYLGEINDSQKAAWCKTIEVLAVFTQPPDYAVLSIIEVMQSSGICGVADVRSRKERQFGSNHSA